MNTITSIDSFKFKLDIFDLSIFDVSYEKNMVSYAAYRIYYQQGTEHEIKIAQKDNDLFLSELNQLSIIDWQNEYTNFNVLDGETWGLEISFNNGSIKNISGSNCYPGIISISCERTPVFNKLLEAIRTLIQEPEFFAYEYLKNCNT